MLSKLISSLSFVLSVHLSVPVILVFFKMSDNLTEKSVFRFMYFLVLVKRGSRKAGENNHFHRAFTGVLSLSKNRRRETLARVATTQVLFRSPFFFAISNDFDCCFSALLIDPRRELWTVSVQIPT